MLSCGQVIRLTRKERAMLKKLAGVTPPPIRTRAQLTQFVMLHLAQYNGPSPEERLLRAMLEGFLPHRLALRPPR